MRGWVTRLSVSPSHSCSTDAALFSVLHECGTKVEKGDQVRGAKLEEIERDAKF